MILTTDRIRRLVSAMGWFALGAVLTMSEWPRRFWAGGPARAKRLL